MQIINNSNKNVQNSNSTSLINNNKRNEVYTSNSVQSETSSTRLRWRLW
jgi:hypothetical protein